MSKEQGRLIQKLHRLYDNPVSRDVFGRRKATAREIEASIKPETRPFSELLEQHLPTQQDINVKKDTK